MKKFISIILALTAAITATAQGQWVRINQLGYLPDATKVAVLMSKDAATVSEFQIVDAFTGETVFKGQARATGAYGLVKGTWRLNFSDFKKEGSFRIKAGDAVSEIFPINGAVYNGTADLALNYMRQQRCGRNPLLRDSCHTKDAYIVYPPPKSGQRIDVTGGWHDATDCLQYTTTSANAIYQMMFAYKQNPEAFGDTHKADGTPGKNGIPDIVDEIYWGLDWLDRMNPEPGEFYNQIADDRDHMGFRVPSQDKADYGYGPGNGRVVYFVTGEKQVRGTYMNATMGAASTAGKFASDFALGSEILAPFYPEFAKKIGEKAADAYKLGVEKPGNCQTASVMLDYIYEEDNWVDDMELGAMELYHRTGDSKFIDEALEYGRREPVTPWMGADSARHYQWYPFMNMGHYWIAKDAGGRASEEFIRNLRAGIQRTYEKAKDTPFLYGIPSIWCSNNLTTAMITQCILYRQLTGDRTYEEMEGSLRDWLLGCNPWGTSMIIDLPVGGVYPTMPHSFIMGLGIASQGGGLVDGPVYSTIFNKLEGVNMEGGINYLDIQPDVMVYHDCEHDYSTNEPTMDGTACLTFPLSTYEKEGREQSGARVDRNVYVNGGIIRHGASKKRICLVFTAADRADGADPIINALHKYNVKGGFFFTGEFYEKFPDVIQRLRKEGHYVGSHSYGHLLYSSWEKRDSMLVTKEEFQKDILKSYALMEKAGISKEEAPYFIPPYEHYNSTISSWAKEMGLQVINYTPGTSSNGDYTTPSMKNYYSSKVIMNKIKNLEKAEGLNGHFLMIHFGTVPERTDKFYNKLPQLITYLRNKGYEFVSVEEALGLEMK
ncbi:MAG: glycoside hydrolase family 9 protein [Bacteroidales bacterium]|nr:glycoside hydrolase family 9 protein [Bacteroidales bacterium]